MKEQDAAHSFEKKTPSWYTADEMYHWLIREKYSEVIAKELCQKWSEDLQGAFNKGYEKARNQAIQDCIEVITLNNFSLLSEMVKALEQLKTKP